ncbi:MAG: DUF3127 domain-containing protein [Flammeovirgaceae bacterium]
MAFEVKGKLEVIYETQQVTERFKKREFVLEVQNGMYPEYVKFQLTQDRCGLLDPFSTGEEINVSFNLKGRPYTKDGRTTYFTNLEAWRIDGANVIKQTPAATGSSASTTGGSDDISGMSFSEAGEDELPF